MRLLSKAITHILGESAGIVINTGGGNIWHGRIPQHGIDGTDKVADLTVMYYVYAITPNDTKTGASKIDEQMLRVHVVGYDDELLSETAALIRHTLDRLPPAEYAGIKIQGSRFLNGYFDPDDNYQLEQQQWVLEFQFRVENI